MNPPDRYPTHAAPVPQASATALALSGLARMRCRQVCSATHFRQSGNATSVLVAQSAAYPAQNTPAASPGSDSPRSRWHAPADVVPSIPRARASSKIASAKPCQLVSPRRHQMADAGCGSPCATPARSRRRSAKPASGSRAGRRPRATRRVRRHAQHGAQEVVAMQAIHPGRAQDQMAGAAGADAPPRRPACLRRRRPTAQVGSSSR